jgi:hypothetical protein
MLLPSGTDTDTYPLALPEQSERSPSSNKRENELQKRHHIVGVFQGYLLLESTRQVVLVSTRCG